MSRREPRWVHCTPRVLLTLIGIAGHMISAADEALRTAVVVRGSFAQWPQSPARLEEEEGGWVR
jgi:hypothetical protein